MTFSRRDFLAAGAAGGALLGGCASSGETTVAPVAGDASTQLTAILDRAVAMTFRRAPELCTSLGITEERAGYRFIDKVSDRSKAAGREARALQQAALAELRAINRNALPPRDQVTYDVVATAWENNLANSAFEVGGGVFGDDRGFLIHLPCEPAQADKEGVRLIARAQWVLLVEEIRAVAIAAGELRHRIG